MNIVFIISVYDFVTWFFFLLIPRLRYSFFTQRIQTQQSVATVRNSMNNFIHEYLQHDGFLILRLIHSNVGDDITSNILTTLWKHYQRTDKPKNDDCIMISSTTSLAASGNRSIYTRSDKRQSSIFDYSKTSTNL